MEISKTCGSPMTGSVGGEFFFPHPVSKRAMTYFLFIHNFAVVTANGMITQASHSFFKSPKTSAPFGEINKKIPDL